MGLHVLRPSGDALGDFGDDGLHVRLDGGEDEHGQRVRELLDEIVQTERLEDSLDACRMRTGSQR